MTWIRSFHGDVTKRFAVLQWALTVLVLLPIALFTFLQLDVSERQRLRDNVNARTQSLISIYRTGGLAATARFINERTIQREEKVYLLTDARGKKLAGNMSQWPSGVPVPSDRAVSSITPDGSSRPERASMKTILLPGGERLLVGSVLLARRETQYTIIAGALATLLLMFPIAWIVGNLQERYLDKRIEEISEGAAAFAAGDLSRRVETRGEASTLAVSLNRTFDRLQLLVEDLVFVTDALAHELRSPLTRLSALLEKLGPAVAEEGAAALDRMAAEIEGMLRIINSTLELSRAGAEGASTFDRIDLCEIVHQICEVYEASAEQLGVSLVLNICDRCECLGNRDLLAQAVANLLDNALKYSRGTQVELCCAREGSGCLLSVADDGTGIAEHDRNEALRKFGRLDRARTSPGSGLGLTFVKVVASLHGGNLVLSDNKPGLRATFGVGS